MNPSKYLPSLSSTLFGVPMWQLCLYAFSAGMVIGLIIMLVRLFCIRGRSGLNGLYVALLSSASALTIVFAPPRSEPLDSSTVAIGFALVTTVTLLFTLAYTAMTVRQLRRPPTIQRKTTAS